MDAETIRERFELAREQLFNWVDGDTLLKHALRIVEAQDNREEHARELRAYLSMQSDRLQADLGELFRVVKPHPSARLWCMKLLTGTFGPWAPPANGKELATSIASNLRQLVVVPWDKINDEFSRRWKAKGEKAATKWKNAQYTVNYQRMNAVSEALEFEAHRVCEHLVQLATKWGNTRVEDRPPAQSFREYFGEERFAKVQEIMDELGYKPTLAKGKGRVVGALNAAIKHYKLTEPRPNQWPAMLEATYPGFNWSKKNTPKRNLGPRSMELMAYTAMLDRLK